MRISRNFFYKIFIASLFFTEFFYISIGNGVARIYHFIALIVVIALLPGRCLQVLNNRVTLGLLFFVLANLLAVMFSDSPVDAAESIMSLMANIGIALSVALILMRGRITIEKLYSLTMLFTVISVLWGLVQTMGAAAGIPLGLSPEQDSQIAIGFGPAFRTEANAFGKFLVFPFLLFLPRIVQGGASARFKAGFALIVIGILVNFTRSALIGLAIAAVYVAYSYFMRGRLASLFKRTLVLSAIIGMLLTGILSGILPASDYAKFKMENIFNSEEMLYGVSSQYRVSALEDAWRSILSDEKKLLIGDGWGQLKIEFQGKEVQGGGNDLVNVVGYGGIVALLAYIFYSFKVFGALRTATRRAREEESRLVMLGFTFAFVGIFVTAQLTGHLITPEYWLLVGVGLYAGTLKRRSDGAAEARM